MLTFLPVNPNCVVSSISFEIFVFQDLTERGRYSPWQGNTNTWRLFPPSVFMTLMPLSLMFWDLLFCYSPVNICSITQNGKSFIPRKIFLILSYFFVKIKKKNKEKNYTQDLIFFCHMKNVMPYHMDGIRIFELTKMQTNFTLNSVCFTKTYWQAFPTFLKKNY